MHALKEQMQYDGELTPLELTYGGPVPSYATFETETQDVAEALVAVYDDISGEELPSHLVQAARTKDIEWVRSVGLYDKVPRRTATD